MNNSTVTIENEAQTQKPQLNLLCQHPIENIIQYPHRLNTLQDIKNQFEFKCKQQDTLHYIFARFNSNSLLATQLAESIVLNQPQYANTKNNQLLTPLQVAVISNQHLAIKFALDYNKSHQKTVFLFQDTDLLLLAVQRGLTKIIILLEFSACSLQNIKQSVYCSLHMKLFLKIRKSTEKNQITPDKFQINSEHIDEKKQPKQQIRLSMDKKQFHTNLRELDEAQEKTQEKAQEKCKINPIRQSIQKNQLINIEEKSNRIWQSNWQNVFLHDHFSKQVYQTIQSHSFKSKESALLKSLSKLLEVALNGD